MRNTIYRLVIILMSLVTTFSHATDVLTQRSIGLDVANDIAKLSIDKCRDMGYQVSVVVVDKHSNVRSAMRDDLAARQTLEIATRKAGMVIMSGIASGTFRSSRADIQQELNHITGLIVMQGGLPISAGGSVIGAVGISGAPGGDIDEACAQHALDQVSERLEFAD